MASRWFHSDISEQAAHDLLLSQGQDSSFLVRRSNNPGDFAISVRHCGEVTKIKIQNDGDCFSLYGSPDPFPTLNDLVRHYMENPGAMKLKQGDVINLRYPIASEDPTTERWFHGPLNAKSAEQALLSKGRIGNFLVRESQSKPGQYVLTVRTSDAVSHVMIYYENSRYHVGSGDCFASLVKLINHFRSNQELRSKGDNNPIQLDEPFHSTSFMASTIGKRIDELKKQHKQGLTGFREEFEYLQYFDVRLGVYTTKEGRRQENKGKNRYKNILPYDHSRVVLRDGDPAVIGSEYVNANYVTSELKSSRLEYVASQGCLPATIFDFWRLVYQERCCVILMLTNEVEKGKNKCARYWPELGVPSDHGKFVIENLTEHETQDYTVREMRLFNRERSRKEPPHPVYQYHYTVWPDHGVPQDPGSVMALLNEMHRQHVAAKSKGPILVHCSAGIGRTGTVMAIDVLMHIIEERGLDTDIDVQKTVQLLRSQRSGMIQTEVQYRFVYQAVQHYIDTKVKRMNSKQAQAKNGGDKAIYCNLPSSPPATRVRAEDKVNPVPKPNRTYTESSPTPTNSVPKRSNASKARSPPMRRHEAASRQQESVDA